MKGKSKEIQSTPEGAYRFGEFQVYPSERQLHRQNTEAPLPPKAFDAMMLLVRKAGQLVRKEELIEALWPDTYVTEANLTNIVVVLRKVLGHDAIQTASKYGYRLALPVLGEPEPRWRAWFWPGGFCKSRTHATSDRSQSCPSTISRATRRWNTSPME
jgi:DNA-binding winged helix-turn-helix (wHTH) protein